MNDRFRFLLVFHSYIFVAQERGKFITGQCLNYWKAGGPGLSTDGRRAGVKDAAGFHRG
jgi:hypothetical protein